jgi:hypothetical protein
MSQANAFLLKKIARPPGFVPRFGKPPDFPYPERFAWLNAEFHAVENTLCC